MWSRQQFADRFGRPLFVMIHLPALPGSPEFESMRQVIDSALRDARAAAAGGASGIVFENFGDRPFFKSVGAETVAAMTRVITEVTGEVNLPFGVNVLRNDGESALAIAAATGAAFIRVNVLVGAMLTDQGLIEGRAAELLRLRHRLAPDVAIFADHLVKHAVPLVDYEPMQLARDTRLRGRADALIVSGKETGASADPVMLGRLREVVDAPLLLGSGLSLETAAAYDHADGAIVGTSLKREGRLDAPVDADRVARLSERWTATS
jgi:uncharacterized protein